MSAPRSVHEVENYIRRCREETLKFRAGRPHDESPCYELFRLAIAGRNQAAWTALYDQYHPLVTRWVRKHPRFQELNEPPDRFVNAAFTRFWYASQGRFAQFPSLGVLLRYLQTCAHSAIADHLRAQQRRAKEISIGNRWDGWEERANTPEGEVIDRLEAEALEWAIRSVLRNEAEEVVMTLSWMYGLPPRQIQARHPELFATVQQVYQIKRNLLYRLARDPEVQRFFGKL